MRDISYTGRRVVLTGGFSGIGAALVEVLRELGADDITVLDLKAPTTPVERFISTDMGNPVSIDAASTAIGPGVDVLFNNAGIAATRPAEQVMRVNILGLKRLTERLLPGMKAGGAIVNTASTAGNQWPGNLEVIRQLLAIQGWDEGVAWIHDHMPVVADGYFFSKQCVQVYTMMLSRPAIRQGVRVNSICPSPVDTPLLPAFRATMTDRIIDWAIAEGAGRVATPRDQAKALAFLGSDLASYVNGVNLLVDGGFTAAMTTGQADLSALAGA
jgi:NAD(P)-dependent dehydrogenase (short-subunit alcohol dehydrogenase family)